MYSYWMLHYSGPHAGVVIQKLERLLKVKLVALKRSRKLDSNHQLIEKAEFLIKHKSTTWADLVLELLSVVNVLSDAWIVTIGKQGLSGYFQSDELHRCPAISNLNYIFWRITQDQQYPISLERS